MHKCLYDDVFKTRLGGLHAAKTAQVWPHTKYLPLRATAKNGAICRHQKETL